MAGEGKGEDWVTLTRRGDYGRFLAIEAGPVAIRPALYVLTALHLELDRIVATVSEPLIGHIRLAWWREAFAEIADGKPPRAHPLLQALAALHAAYPALMPYLTAMVEAREAALDPEGVADEAAWHASIDATDGSLHQVWAVLLGVDPAYLPYILQAARCYGAINRLRAIPFLPQSRLRQFPATLRTTTGVTSFAPGDALKHLCKAILADSCNSDRGEVATVRLPKPLRALDALARLHRRHIASVGHDPYRVGPGKLASVWCVLRA